MPQCKGFLRIPTVAPGIWFSMDIVLEDANTPEYEAIRSDHEDDNFPCRRLSPRSFSTLLLPFFGSDKPFESVRSARVLP